MFYLYILQSEKNGHYYIGSAENLKGRLKRHNAGEMKSTRPFIPYRIVYSEKHEALSKARKRESYIKRRKSRKYIESLIKLKEE